MPVHEWSRVDANAFHHFHQCWTIAICDALNGSRLPSGYSALVEQHAGGLVPDVLSVNAALAARGNRVAIRHRLKKVVCVLEIISPGNKSGKAVFRDFVDKSVELLRQGIHLLVVDILPPTKRDPQGIHKAIWDKIEDEPFEPPPDKPLTLAAYVAGSISAGIETQAYVESVGVGDPLPDMPAFIDPNGYVPVPLEATYQAAWARCPADLREWVETGKVPGEEE